MKKTPIPDRNGISFRLWAIIVGIAIYLLVFFAVPFEPYVNLGGNSLTRGWFFWYLLFPDDFFATWLGPDGTVSLADRIPILLTTCLCLMAATGMGGLCLTVGGIVRRLSSLETWVFSTVVGLSLFSLLVLGIGCCGNLNDMKSVCFATGFAALGFCFFCLLRFYSSTDTKMEKAHKGIETRKGITSVLYEKKISFFIILPIFSVCLVLGGMIPSTDYDVLSYHLPGAREFVESGYIGFLPHNVYANMPFGAEMFAVWGIALTGKSLTGALIGKTIISATTILTALGVYTFGRRFFSEAAGLIGMVLYLTTPWIFYVSTTGLIDSVVGMYTFFALYAVSMEYGTSIVDRREDQSNLSRQYIFLAGFLAGSAAACKYPAVLFIVAPLGIWFLAVALKSKERKYYAITTVLIFFLAVFLACGGWFVKNWYYTGNPVYPLGYSLFGDSTGTWNSEVDARWIRVHSPHEFGPSAFLDGCWNVAMRSPWNSPIIVPLCLLVFVVVLPTKQKRLLQLLAVWLLFVFLAWWLLTHRIDRFWLVTIPILSVFAGVGSTFCAEKLWKRTLWSLMTIACVYGFLVGTAPAPGKINHYLASVHSVHSRMPWPTWFNAHPPRGKILLVGEAKSFLFDVPVLYNSCFNETPLSRVALSANPAAELNRLNIEYILVDWSEIRRFRSPGNYGYSEVVQEKLFDRLVAAGVLRRFCPTEDFENHLAIVYKVESYQAQ